MKNFVKLLFAAAVLLIAQSALAQNPQTFDITVDFDPFANFTFTPIIDPTADDVFNGTTVTLGTIANGPAAGLTCNLDITTLNDFSLDSATDTLTDYTLGVAGLVAAVNGGPPILLGSCDFTGVPVDFTAVNQNTTATPDTYTDTVTLTLSLI